MTHDTDLIRRIDAMQATQVGPSDEWAKATKSGYNQAATDIAMNIMKIAAAHATVQVKPLIWNDNQATDLYGDLYEVVEDSGAYEIEHPRLFNCYHKFPTPEAAKAAAQADYAARILAALDVHPAPDVAKIKADALREAHTELRKIIGDWKAAASSSHRTRGTYPDLNEKVLGKILALIDTPPDAMAGNVAALVEAAAGRLKYGHDYFCKVRSELGGPCNCGEEALRAAISAMKGDAT